MKEEKLVAVAQSVIADDTVGAAGLFNPASGMNTLGAGNHLTFTNKALVNGLPAWSLLAVSATKVHLIAVRSQDGWNADEPVHITSWDRDAISVTMKMRGFGFSKLTIEDEATQQEWSFVGPAHGVWHADVIFHLFQHDSVAAEQ